MENESNKNETAVQWFIEQLEQKGDAWENVSIRRIQISIDVSDYLELKRQAKQMEKNQIENAYANGVDDEYEYHINDEPRKNTEQYYAEKYGKITFLDLVSDEESQVHEVVKKLKENKIQGGNK
jgi:hypothetical protein